MVTNLKTNNFFKMGFIAMSLHIIALILYLFLPKGHTDGESTGFFLVLFVLPFTLLNSVGFLVLYSKRQMQFTMPFSKALTFIFLLISFIHSLFIVYASIMTALT
jgi:hypothetical protein